MRVLFVLGKAVKSEVVGVNYVPRSGDKISFSKSFQDDGWPAEATIVEVRWKVGDPDDVAAEVVMRQGNESGGK